MGVQTTERLLATKDAIAKHVNVMETVMAQLIASACKMSSAELKAARDNARFR